MDQKKTCEICNRLYKTPPLKYFENIPDTSRVYIRFTESDNLTIYSGDICPNCARELIWKIKTMKRNAPKNVISVNSIAVHSMYYLNLNVKTVSNIPTSKRKRV